AAPTPFPSPSLHDALPIYPEGTGDDETDITIGVFAGWDENYVVYELLRTALEEQGYTVTARELPEAGAVFTGVADGDIDVIVDRSEEHTSELQSREKLVCR